MTRINVIPVRQLSDAHLRGEKKEITRVFTHVRKAVASGTSPEQLNGPKNYVLGTGHVKFFYPKLKWIWERYIALSGEMQRRGCSVTIIPLNSLMEGIAPSWFRTYTPSQEDILINRFRLVRRDKQDHYNTLDWDIVSLTDEIFRRGLENRLAPEDRSWLKGRGSLYEKRYQPIW